MTCGTSGGVQKNDAPTPDNLGVQLIKCLPKQRLKTIMKNRIKRRLDIFIKTEAENMTKLRFCSNFKEEIP